jgi:polygalacturonase
MWQRWIALCVCLGFVMPAMAKTTDTYNVKKLGAAGDGKTKDTAIIQKAIDAASDTGGGTVLLPTGTYLSGTLRLKSNVTIHFDRGATLLGSTDIDDYPHIWPKFKSFTDNYLCQSLIYAEDVENIAITGFGTIDGQGDADTFKNWRKHDEKRKYGYRPYLIRIVTSKNIVVRDIALLDSPMWVQQYLACDNVVLENQNVYSHTNANNDMIDIDCCHNVRISGCTGDSGDDAITIKSTGPRVSKNIAVTNCVVSSWCNAIKCGTESTGGFQNISITNIAIRRSRHPGPNGQIRSGLAGIALELVDGGVMDRVVVSDIVMEGTLSPIFLRLGNRARPHTDGAPKPGVGKLRNVTISNVVATGAANIGCPISGIPGHPVENLTLSNINLSFIGGGTADQVDREIPENEGGYPESQMFGTLPTYGFYVRHANNVTLDNIRLQYEAPEQRPGLFCNDVSNLTIHNFQAQPPVGEKPSIILNDVQQSLIGGCIAPAGTMVFCRLQGDTKAISLVGNDLSRALVSADLQEGLDQDILFSMANRLE